MALVKRISRLLAADMHAILDQLEEPETVLRQAVRDMDAELARQGQRTKWLATEIEDARQRLAALAAARAELDSKLDIAFANDDDGLARRLIRRKLETSRLEAHHEARRIALEDDLAEHEALVAADRERLEHMRRKVELLTAGARAGCGHGDDAAAGAVDADDVELALLREKQARSRP